MMRMRRLALALLCTLAACSTKDDPKITAADITGTVVLESYTLQLGWDYRLSGIYIDGDGIVWTYEHNGTPWYPEKLKRGELSERDMVTKHKGARQIGTVDTRTLLDNARLIAAASRGHITRAHDDGTGDTGGTLEVAYRLDTTKRVYKEVILSGSGDRTATNASGEARALLDYLREVQTAVGYPAP